MKLNHNLDTLRLSGIRQFTALAAEVGGCIMLTLGEPEFDTPRPIVDACKAALDEGYTHYTENRGDAALRCALSAFETEKRGLCYTPDEIIITAGATEAIFIAMLGILNPGDQVVIPTPAFGLYNTIARVCGAVPVSVDTAPHGFQLTAEALENVLTPRTKLLILNSPNNPTGVIYSPENLDAIAALVKKHGIYVLSDDVYWGLSPCPTFSQQIALKEQSLSVQSFSKPYAMTGWRVGYLMAARPIVDKLISLHGHCVTCVPSMLQRACLAAISYDPTPMAQAYARRRHYVLERLKKMGLPCAAPKGAFYVFPKIDEFGIPSQEFCTRLIKEARVATVPGSVFGTEGYLRMSYCCSMEALEQGLDRLALFIENLRKKESLL